MKNAAEIEKVMTRFPHYIGLNQPISTARKPLISYQRQHTLISALGYDRAHILSSLHHLKFRGDVVG